MSTRQPTLLNLTDLLKERRLTQIAFARLVEKPETTVNRWVTGRSVPQLTNQDEVVEVLNKVGEERGLVPVSADEIWGSERA